ncbi:MAG: plasmid stabilization protein [Balneolaceae bacterium]|nr:MAG: plasmid stabilization protein [Balneolaceae bacterium]
MPNITIRNIDDSLKRRLCIQAAKPGRSMEEEVQNILISALSVEEESGENLADFIRSRIEPIGGVDLPEIPREPVNFDE